MHRRLRPYQLDLKHAVYAEWQRGNRMVMMQLSTGAGKTPILGEAIKEFDAPTAAIAHRQELVSQISIQLAREGIRHSIIAADKKVVRAIVAAHCDDEDIGRSYYDPTSHVRVAGVDTLVRMNPEADRWFRQVRLVVPDEAHHVLLQNKWGQSIRMFPHDVYGLLPTATPRRADGMGLGRHHDGLADALVVGPPMRQTINSGYLTDYRVIWARPAVDLSNVQVSETTGDLNLAQARQAVHASPTLVGDVVREYLRWAPGKLGVTFAIDVESATEIAEAYRRAGVPAEVVHGKTPDSVRRNIIKRFRKREILQLVNVDLFGEGFDLPAIEVVSMARPTRSFALFAQQFGRALRLMISPILMGVWDTYTDAQRLQFIAESEKPIAIIIDHVDNIERNGGLPDKPQVWSLDRREKKSRGQSDAIPLRRCLSCFHPYERFLTKCPRCGERPPPPDRASIKTVDGDLHEAPAEWLAMMRSEVVQVDAPNEIPYSMQGTAAGRGLWRALNNTKISQQRLRHAIGSWHATRPDLDTSEGMKLFYFLFGIDVLSATCLKSKDAEKLHEKIANRLAIDGYVISEQTYPCPPISDSE